MKISLHIQSRNCDFFRPRPYNYNAIIRVFPLELGNIGWHQKQNRMKGQSESEKKFS